MSTFLARRITRLIEEGRVICATGGGPATLVNEVRHGFEGVNDSRAAELSLACKQFEGSGTRYMLANRGYLISHGGSPTEFVLAYSARNNRNTWGITATSLATLHWNANKGIWDAHMGNIGGIIRCSVLNSYGKAKLAWRKRGGPVELVNRTMEEELESMRMGAREYHAIANRKDF